MNVDQRKKKKKMMMNRADWAGLPKDVLILIMEKLVWSERVRLPLLCKSWLECFHEIQNTQEFLPWVMSYDWGKIGGRGGGICNLCDPAAKRSYTVKEAAIMKNRDFYGAAPCESKYGWVLFSKALSNTTCFFFFSPFTNEVIVLPELEKKRYRRATFSFSPSSPNCTVIALSIPEPGKLEIQTCQLVGGDDDDKPSWKMYEHEFSGEYTSYGITEPVYTGESFYSIFLDGKVGAFNTKTQEWKVLSEESPVTELYYRQLVVGFNGDLLLCRPTTDKELRYCFWRFNVAERRWVAMEEQEMEIMEKKHVIFKDGPFYSLSVPAVGNARESAGKMYYVGDHFLPLSHFFFRSELPTLSKDYKCLPIDEKLFHVWIQSPFQTKNSTS